MNNLLRSSERFTDNLRKIIELGYTFAQSLKSPEFLPIHLFYIVIKSENLFVKEIIEKVNLNLESTLESIKKTIDKDLDLQKVEYTGTVFSLEINNVLSQSLSVAKELNSPYVSLEHLFLAMYQLNFKEFFLSFSQKGVDEKYLKKLLQKFSFTNSNKNNIFSTKGNIEDKNVPSFVTDLNEEAEKKGFSNITGRDTEIERLIHILSRKNKNNPILIGDAGVGKTAIVEGLVNKILKKDVPHSFINKRILSFDISAVMAGTKLRGDLEEKISDLLKFLQGKTDVILFIDEIHNIVGAGSVTGKDGLDIANILKPYLINSGISVLGATTFDEYKRYFEPDIALSRRFQSVFVEELDEESSIEVILNLKKEFEDFHKIKIEKDIIETAVKLAKRYINDRYLPDKAIDIIDEASSKVKINREISLAPILKENYEELIALEKKKRDLLSANKILEAAKIKTKIMLTKNTIQSVLEGKKYVKKEYQKKLLKDDIVRTVASMSNIPIVSANFGKDSAYKIKENLKKKIVGQDLVVENVADTILRAHLGLQDSSRPLASFLFLGPTGVGKTQLAKYIAEELFGSPEMIFQIDMSEYMESHSIAKLIGAPPGYIGYSDGGKLTNHLRKKPYSVILFDEIEKAHPDTLNILLQILDEGKITDSTGKSLNLKNTIIILTSNIGVEEIQEDKILGFNLENNKSTLEEEIESYNAMRNRLMEELKNSLPPEFINRIDSIEVFKTLNKEDFFLIAEKLLENFSFNLLEKNISISIEKSVIDCIVERAYSKEYGARNIKRKIQELIENSIARFIVTKNLNLNSKKLVNLCVNLEADQVVIKKENE